MSNSIFDQPPSWSAEFVPRAAINQFCRSTRNFASLQSSQKYQKWNEWEKLQRSTTLVTIKSKLFRSYLMHITTYNCCNLFLCDGQSNDERKSTTMAEWTCMYTSYATFFLSCTLIWLGLLQWKNRPQVETVLTATLTTISATPKDQMWLFQR